MGIGGKATFDHVTRPVTGSSSPALLLTGEAVTVTVQFFDLQAKKPD